jgi:AcrR family transcriptional regulator
MPKVTAEYRESRKHEIAAAALRLFALKGFQATSMADIIAESGLSAGAIYGHFKGKDELIHSAIDDLLEFRLPTLDSGGTAAPIAPGELLRRILEGIQTDVTDIGLLLQVWAQAALDTSSREATDRVGTHIRAVLELYLFDWYRRKLDLPEAEATQAATLYAGLYLGILQGYVIQNAIFESFDREAYLAAASAVRPDFSLLS